MPSTHLPLKIDDAYAKLKTQLNQNKAKITAQNPPNSLTAIQGSLWGTTPKTAHKKISFTLEPDAKGTNVTSKSQLTSAYINLTTIGVILSVALMLICAWIALDLQAYLSFGSQGLWTWLGQIHSRLNVEKAALFIKLTWILTAFLAASLALEGLIIFRVKTKIGAYAEEIVKATK